MPLGNACVLDMLGGEIRSTSQLHQTVHAGNCRGERQLVQVQPQVPHDLSKAACLSLLLWPWKPQSRHSDPNTSMCTPQESKTRITTPYYRASERLYSVEKQYLTSSGVLDQEYQVIDPLCRETVVRP